MTKEQYLTTMYQSLSDLQLRNLFFLKTVCTKNPSKERKMHSNVIQNVILARKDNITSFVKQLKAK